MSAVHKTLSFNIAPTMLCKTTESSDGRCSYDIVILCLLLLSYVSPGILR